MNLADAITSLKKVLKGIPNLTATIEDCIAEALRSEDASQFYFIASGDVYAIYKKPGDLAQRFN